MAGDLKMTDPAETDPAGTVAGNQVDTGTGKLFLPDMDISELEEFFAGIGQKKYRAKQVFGWIAKGAVSFDEMTDLPLALRRI